MSFSPDILRTMFRRPFHQVQDCVKTLRKRAKEGTAPESIDVLDPQVLKHTTLSQVFNQQASSLVISVHHSPAHTLKGVWPLLQPGAPFVVHFPFLQPLADLQQQLVKGDNQQAAQVTLFDTSALREMQVLPNRTHPVVDLSLKGSGYVLTGCKLMQSSPFESLEIALPQVL